MINVISENQTFSASRYWSLLKRYLVENRKSLLFFTGVVWGVIMLICVNIGRFLDVAIELSLFAALFMVFACLSASYMFSSLRTKELRVNTLMLPASMLEKYMVRFTVYIVMFVPMYLLACVAGDLVRALVHDSETIWSFDFDWFLGRFSVMSVLMYQSLYALGSSLWPRHSFFKTFLALFGLMFACMLFFPWSAFLWFDEISEFGLYAFMVSVTVAAYVAAWFRFRSVQVVQRFM